MKGRGATCWPPTRLTKEGAVYKKTNAFRKKFSYSRGKKGWEQRFAHVGRREEKNKWRRTHRVFGGQKKLKRAIYRILGGYS